MWTKRNLLTAILAVGMLLALANVARPATPEQIENAIDAGVAWLVANQNGDGSWGGVGPGSRHRLERYQAAGSDTGNACRLQCRNTSRAELYLRPGGCRPLWAWHGNIIR